MRRSKTFWSVVILGLGSASFALAQPPGFGPPGGQGGPGGFGGQGGPGGPGGDMMRMLPIMAALDADGDGEISGDEIAKSVVALNGLDKNKDGKLTTDELRPEFGGRGGPGGERGGPGGERGRGGPEGDSAGLVNRLMALDKNQDGKLAKDEVEGRMQAIFERADADHDGFATKEEIEKIASAAPEGDGPRRGGPGEGGPGEGGRGPGEGGRGQGGGPGEGGRGPGGGPGEGGRGPGGFGGPPNPEQFINHAFEFDADKDGKLSKEELTKMLSESGPMGGGRGPERTGGEGGAGRRPNRPASE